jgi:hypothetical protein
MFVASFRFRIVLLAPAFGGEVGHGSWAPPRHRTVTTLYVQ